MCNEAIDTYPSEIKFVLECYKTTKRGNTVVDKFHFVFDSVRDWYKTQQNVW